MSLDCVVSGWLVSGVPASGVAAGSEPVVGSELVTGSVGGGSGLVVDWHVLLMHRVPLLQSVSLEHWLVLTWQRSVCAEEALQMYPGGQSEAFSLHERVQ